MISFEYAKSYCCEDISKIENYEKAMADTSQTWECHHRLEYVDGKVTSRKDLEAKGLLYKRPASELIFLTPKAHDEIPKYTEESKKKISEANKGEKNGMYGRTGELAPMYGKTGEKHPMYGKHHSEESRRKISENHADFSGEKHPMYGKHHSDETKRKLSEIRQRQSIAYKEYKKNGGTLSYPEWRGVSKKLK